MNALYRFLFPMKPASTAFSLFLLAMRLLFGSLFLIHGFQKLMNYGMLSSTFPDPLGFSSELSLFLTILAEIGCSVAFMFGFLYRLFLLPMIFAMTVACFIIHAKEPFAAKELAFVYLSVFVLMYIAGPGKYSLDQWIGKKSRH